MQLLSFLFLKNMYLKKGFRGWNSYFNTKMMEDDSIGAPGGR